MKERIDYTGVQEQHKLRYQDQLFHAVALDTNAVVTYKTLRPRKDGLSSDQVDASFTQKELQSLKTHAIEARRRNYIETGAEPHEVETILDYGKIIDAPTVMVPGSPLVIKKKL